ncbi:MAG: hypothetical protein AAFQ27_05105 [Pseudomonadota bacterium]
MLGAVLAMIAVQGAEQSRAMPPVEPAIGDIHWRDIDFVPFGWKLFDKAEGDLDGDGRVDSVLIIQKNDPDLVIENPDGLGMDRYDSNPRMVLVALQSNPGQYKLVVRDAAIIPDHNAPTISDPFEDLRIHNGSLHLDLAFFANAGSWTAFNRRFQFRWNGDAMALIGFESSHVHRGSGEIEMVSVNYLTGRRKDAKGNISDDETHWRWRDVQKGNRPVLGSIGNGFDFEG